MWRLPRHRVLTTGLKMSLAALAQPLVLQATEYSQPKFEAADLVERVGRVRRTPFTLETEPVGRQLDLGLPDHRFDLGQLLGGASWQGRRPVWVRLGV